jgi:hypothetical protein
VRDVPKLSMEAAFAEMAEQLGALLRFPKRRSKA